MLIPRYSIRWMLGIMTLCGLFFLVVSLGVRGHVWAAAIAIAVAALVLAILVQAVFFVVAYWAAVVAEKLFPKRPQRSPFASHAPPPQLLRPDEPQ
jgi:amino acid transporter